MDFFDGLAYYFFILIPVSAKKNSLDPDPDSVFLPDPDSNNGSKTLLFPIFLVSDVRLIFRSGPAGADP